MLISKKRVLLFFLIVTVLFSMTGVNIIQVQANEYNNLLYSIENGEITITGIKGLVTEIEIPAEISGYPVTKIAAEAFYQSDCHEILEKVELPDTITNIGKYAFAKCDKLQSIKIPQKVVTLYDSTFSYCFSLRSLFIYNTLENIGEYVFDVCPLENIYYSGSEEEYNNIFVASNNAGLKSANVFYNCTHIHEFKDYISDNNATCETNCTETAKCTKCDVVNTRDIPNTALGHNWDIWVVTKNATMTETGEKHHVCKNDSSHIETVTIPVLDSPFAGGSGTEEDPYQVSTPEQLNEVRNNLDKYFIQTNDIDMSGVTSKNGKYWNDGSGWIAIGDIKNKFAGSYNGGDYKIIGLYCKGKLGGLFGYNSGVIKNVAMIEGNIVGTGALTGGIVSCNNGTITGCYNANKVTTTYTAGTYSIGGIAGKSSGSSSFEKTISNCYNTGAISSLIVSSQNSDTGGIIGLASYTNIENCFNIGSVSNKGTVRLNDSSQYSNVGGILGYGTNVNISRCFNDYEILGVDAVGGIVGIDMFSNIFDCYNKGLVKTSGTTYAKAISGTSINSRIENAYNSNLSVQSMLTSVGTTRHIYSVNSGLSVTVLTLDEMKQKDKFVGFDFDTIWDISPNINDGMPYLRGVGNLQPTMRVGDVNGDNEIDFRDAQLIMQYEAGLISLTDEQKSAADINKDGEIDFFDAQLIMMYEAGLISSL